MKSKKIAIIGIAAALSFVLGTFEIYHLPQGGGISLYHLPIIYVSWFWGWKEGFWTGLLSGILSLLRNMIIVNPWQIVLDYFLPNFAFVIVSFSGKSRLKLFFYIVIAYLFNFTFHFLSGVFFFLKGEISKRIWASFTYNASYTLPEMILMILIFQLLYFKLLKFRRIKNGF